MRPLLEFWKRSSAYGDTDFAFLCRESLPPTYRDPLYTAVLIDLSHGDMQPLPAAFLTSYERASSALISEGMSATGGDFSVLLGGKIQENLLILIGVPTNISIPDDSEFIQLDNGCAAVRVFPLSCAHCDPENLVKLPDLSGCVIPLSRTAVHHFLYGSSLPVHHVEFQWKDTLVAYPEEGSERHIMDCTLNRNWAHLFLDNQLGFLVSPMLSVRHLQLSFLAEHISQNDETRDSVMTIVDADTSRIWFRWVTSEHIDPSISRCELPPPHSGLAYSTLKICLDPEGHLSLPDVLSVPSIPSLRNEVRSCVHRVLTNADMHLFLVVYVSYRNFPECLGDTTQVIRELGASKIFVLPDLVVERQYRLIPYHNDRSSARYEKIIRSSVISSSLNTIALSPVQTQKLNFFLHQSDPVPLKQIFGDLVKDVILTHRMTITTCIAAKLTEISFFIDPNYCISVQRQASLTIFGGLSLSPLQQTVLLHAAIVPAPAPRTARGRIRLSFPLENETDETIQSSFGQFQALSVWPPSSPIVRFLTLVFEYPRESEFGFSGLRLKGIASEHGETPQPKPIGSILERLIAFSATQNARAPARVSELNHRLFQLSGFSRADLNLSSALNRVHSAVHDPQWLTPISEEDMLIRYCAPTAEDHMLTSHSKTRSESHKNGYSLYTSAAQNFKVDAETELIRPIIVEWLSEVGTLRSSDDLSIASFNAANGFAPISFWAKLTTCDPRFVEGLQARFILPQSVEVLTIQLTLHVDTGCTAQFFATASPFLNCPPDAEVIGSVTQTGPTLRVTFALDAIGKASSIISVWTSAFLLTSDITLLGISVLGKICASAPTAAATPHFHISSSPELKLAQSPLSIVFRKDYLRFTASLPKRTRIALKAVVLMIPSAAGVKAMRLSIVSRHGQVHPIGIMWLPRVEYPTLRIDLPLTELPQASEAPKIHTDIPLTFSLPDFDLCGCDLTTIDASSFHFNVAVRAANGELEELARASCGILESESSNDISVKVATDIALPDQRAPSLYRDSAERVFDTEELQRLFFNEERLHFCAGRHSGFYY